MTDEEKREILDEASNDAKEQVMSALQTLIATYMPRRYCNLCMEDVNTISFRDTYGNEKGRCMKCLSVI